MIRLSIVFAATVVGMSSPSKAEHVGLGVLGMFTEEAYGARIQRAAYTPDEITAPAPRLAPRPLGDMPDTNTIPPLPERKSTETVIPKNVPGSNEIDVAEQNRLIEQSLVNRAMAIREMEGKSTWKCLHKSAKLMLGHVEAKFGKVDLESTCRPGATIATSGLPSQHGYGKAIDFHPPKKFTKKEVLGYLIAHRRDGWVNGIMTYSNYDHIHIDTGTSHFVALNRHG